MDTNQQIQSPSAPSQVSNPAPVSPKKFPHFILAVIVLVIAGLGVIWYFYQANMDLDKYSMPVEVRRATPTPAGFQVQSQDDTNVDNVDIGNVDGEFKTIDSDVNSL